MKKDFVFAPILVIVGILLFLLQATGMTAHIVVSVIGLVALVAYAVVTKKEWRIPALEIGMRVMYAVALISGIVIKINYIAALAVVHKIGAILFIIALAALLVSKVISSKKV